MAKTSLYVALNGAYGMINGDKRGNRQSICLATAFTVMYDVCVAHPNLHPPRNIIQHTVWHWDAHVGVFETMDFYVGWVIIFDNGLVH